LGRDAGFDDAIAAAGTARWQPRVMRLVDERRLAATGFRAVGAPGLPSWTPGMLLQAFRDRRGLPESSPARVIELSLEMLDLLMEPLIFPPQSLTLALGLFRPLAPVRVGRSAIGVVCLWRSRHAAVMPNSPRGTS
jgi:hypothetical protein